MAETYYDAMFNYIGQAAVTSLTQMYAGTSSSAGPYQPKANGSLVNLVFGLSAQAASSLCQLIEITMTCTLWTPVNTLTWYVTGWGLQTVPISQTGTPNEHQWPVNLPVNTAIGIIANVTTFASPVTPNITITGAFTA